MAAYGEVVAHARTKKNVNTACLFVVFSFGNCIDRPSLDSFLFHRFFSCSHVHCYRLAVFMIIDMIFAPYGMRMLLSWMWMSHIKWLHKYLMSIFLRLLSECRCKHIQDRTMVFVCFALILIILLLLLIYSYTTSRTAITFWVPNEF